MASESLPYPPRSGASGSLFPTWAGAASLPSAMSAWCEAEFRPWSGISLTSDLLREAIAHRHRTDQMAFSFHIRQKQVWFIEKADATPDKVPTWRPPLYQKFLTEVVTEYCPELSLDLIIHVADGGLAQENMPLFSFQKPNGSNAILLPDVDLLEHNFFESPVYQDTIPFMQKQCSAVFVGVTSGMRVDVDVVRERRLPRLRAALFFRGNPKVDFRLPLLDNIESSEAESLLRELGFGRGDTLSYKEQFKSKFLISMDGFGATCSRVAAALLSNCVLLKYDSPHQLYYFRGLRPWIHYLPISEDRDVITAARLEEESPGCLAAIAASGTQFAGQYLSRAAAKAYTAEVLRRYAKLFR